MGEFLYIRLPKVKQVSQHVGSSVSLNLVKVVGFPFEIMVIIGRGQREEGRVTSGGEVKSRELCVL